MKITSKYQRVGIALAAIVILTLPGIGQAADEVCSGTAIEGHVLRLDGINAVVKGTVASRADLTAFGREYKETLRRVLEERGLGDAADGVLVAIESGPMTEVKISQGDTLHWMATRKEGVVTAFGPVCFASSRVYDAWKFDVIVDGMLKETIHTFVIPKVCGNLALAGTRTVVKPPIPVPVVFLGVDRDCLAGVIHVDTSGSSENAMIAVMTPEGIGHPVEAGDLEDPAPYTSDLTFLIVAENTARDGSIQRTEKEVVVPACPAAPAACTLALSGDDFFVRQPIVVNADGHWDVDGFALRILDAKGREIERMVPAPVLPYSTTLDKPGLYRVQGGATNEVGETWGCEATVFVRPRWNVRPKAVVISPTDRATSFEAGLGQQVFDSSIGAELDVEFHPSRLIGLEIGYLGGSLDTHRQVVQGAESVEVTDSVGVSMAHFALNFHFRGRTGVDFFFGPVVAQVDVDDAVFGVLGEWQGGKDTGVGMQLGIDIPLGKATVWNLTGGVRFLRAEFDDDPVTGSVSMDPMVANLGLSFAF